MATYVAALVLALGACSTTPADDSHAAAVRAQDVIASPVRTDQDRRMDASRNPAAFIPFTQVAPGMQVLDVAAGGGYTSQLMALAVGPTGKVWAQRTQPGESITKRLAEAPQANFVVVLRPFDDPVPEQAGKLDLVTLVNNYHDITYLPVDRTKMNANIYAALKAGGRYVVVDHSAKPGCFSRSPISQSSASAISGCGQSNADCNPLSVVKAARPRVSASSIGVVNGTRIIGW